MDPSTGFNFTSKLHNDAYDFVDPKKLDFAGKTVVITGASRGIGEAMAVAYAQGGASNIILAARSPLEDVAKEVLKAAKDGGRPDPKVLTLKVDTTSLEDVKAAAQKVADAFGAVDILVNNAGYLEKFTPVVESDPKEWWKTFEVNVKGVYLVSRSFIPLLLKGESKTIVQLSSIGAHATMSGGSSYNTTKLTVLRFNDFLNCEYGEQGLLAYGIHPGAVMTDLATGMPEETHKIFNDTPELCGVTVPWLTSEKRDWLASRYLSVTWDMEEFLSKKKEIVEKDLLKVKLRL